MRYLWLLVPLAFCLLRLRTHRYVYSALITLSCAAVVALAGPGGAAWLAAAALVVSAVGDWFMSHQKRNPDNFLFGVVGFALAHGLFIAYAAVRFRFSGAALAAALVLTVAYGVYLARRILPAADARLRPALAGYALISLAGLFFALCRNVPPTGMLLYLLGILCILFSDTMIAEADFAGQRWAQPLILPFYYLCHLLITASQL